MAIRATTAPTAMRKNRRKSGPCPRGPRGAPRCEPDGDRDGEAEGDGLGAATGAGAVGVSVTTMGVETGMDGEGAGEP
jgi:hypothetical protein